MASRFPGQLTLPVSLEVEGNALEYDILAEKASALGRSGERAAQLLERLKEHDGDPETRMKLVAGLFDIHYSNVTPQVPIDRLLQL